MYQVHVSGSWLGGHDIAVRWFPREFRASCVVVALFRACATLWNRQQCLICVSSSFTATSANSTTSSLLRFLLHLCSHQRLQMLHNLRSASYSTVFRLFPSVLIHFPSSRSGSSVARRPSAAQRGQPKRVLELQEFLGRSPPPDKQAAQARHRSPLQSFAAVEHREPRRARSRCLRAARSSPAATAPATKLAASLPRACHRSKRAHNSRQVPPWCWWRSSVPVERHTWCPPSGSSGGTPLPAPQRSTAARVATTSAVVAAFAAMRLLRHGRPLTWLPVWVQPAVVAQNRDKRAASKTRCCCCCCCCCSCGCGCGCGCGARGGVVLWCCGVVVLWCCGWSS